MSDDEYDTTCPLCVEEMDLSDQNFLPCPCGYKVCMWCWHHIRENLNGLCPACRTPYNSDPHAFSAVDREDVVKLKKEKKQKEKQEKKVAERIVVVPGVKSSASTVVDRKHLHNYRVVQRNLVYVIGVPSSYASEDMLRKPEFFGQYGKIGKVVIHRNHSSAHSTVSVYVTFVHKEDAKASIQSLDGHWLDQTYLLRASFGTTKYCNNFIRGVPCNNPECVYLHDLGDDDDRFTKEEIQAGHSKITPVPGKDQTLITGGGGPSGTGKRPTGEPVLPPPVFIQDNNPAPTVSTAATATGTTSSTAAATGAAAAPPGVTVARPAAVSRSGTATWGSSTTIAAILSEGPGSSSADRASGSSSTPVHHLSSTPTNAGSSSASSYAASTAALEDFPAPSATIAHVSAPPMAGIKRSASSASNNAASNAANTTTAVAAAATTGGPAAAAARSTAPAAASSATSTPASTTAPATSAKSKAKTAKEIAAERKAAAAASKAAAIAQAAEAAAAAAAAASGESKTSTTAPAPVVQKLSARQQMQQARAAAKAAHAAEKAERAEKAAAAAASTSAGQDTTSKVSSAVSSAITSAASAGDVPLAATTVPESPSVSAKKVIKRPESKTNLSSLGDAGAPAEGENPEESVLRMTPSISSSALSALGLLSEVPQVSPPPPPLARHVGFNGVSTNAVFPAPGSSLSCSVWAYIMRASNEDLSINPYGQLLTPFGELIDLTLPPVDALYSCAPVWPRPMVYYMQGMQTDGITYTSAGKHNHQRPAELSAQPFLPPANPTFYRPSSSPAPPLAPAPAPAPRTESLLSALNETSIEVTPKVAATTSTTAAVVGAVAVEPPTPAPVAVPAARSAAAPTAAAAPSTATPPPPALKPVITAASAVTTTTSTTGGSAFQKPQGRGHKERNNAHSAHNSHSNHTTASSSAAAPVVQAAPTPAAPASGGGGGGGSSAGISALRQLFPGVKMSVSGGGSSK